MALYDATFYNVKASEGFVIRDVPRQIAESIAEELSARRGEVLEVTAANGSLVARFTRGRR